MAPETVPALCQGIHRALWGSSGEPKTWDHRPRAQNRWLERGRKIAHECGTVFERVPVYHCESCQVYFAAAPRGCGLRYCPTCVKWVRARNIRKVKRIIKTFTRPRFATLTIKNQPDLRSMLEFLVASWQRLRWRQEWKRGVKGCVWVVEVTWTRDKGWHAHLHIVWDGFFIPRDKLAADWLACTNGEGKHIWLTAVSSPDHAARELAKYIGKDIGWGKGFSQEPERLAEFVVNMWSYKALRTYGSARKVENEDEKEFLCPECKAPEPRYLGTTMVNNVEHWLAELRGRG